MKTKIGLIQLGRIGDMILITPIFSALKSIFPDSELHLYAGPSNFSIIDNNPDLSKVFVVNKDPIGLLKTIWNLKTNHYQYWIDPKDHFSNESRIIGKIVNAKDKIGFNSPNQKSVFNISLNSDTDNLHHTKIGLNSLMHLGYELPTMPPRPVLYTKSDSNEFVDNFMSEYKLSRFILLNISGSSEHKMWDNNCWVKFFDEIKIKSPVVICFSPSEFGRAIELKRALSKFILFKSRNISDIVSLVSKCNYLISPDTSVVHIAAAFDKPVFALYSGLDNFYTKFHPLSTKYIAVRAEVGDKGIKSIKPNDAIKQFNNFLELLPPQ